MSHLAGRREALECSECFGRSFSDPTKEYHYPECSRYSAWRFGPRGADPITQIIREGFCPHGVYDWTNCPTCSDAADFDDGGDQ